MSARTARKPYKEDFDAPVSRAAEPELDDFSLQLKKQYASQLRSLKDMFGAEWSEGDLLANLEEVKGDLELATNRIIEGTFHVAPVMGASVKITYLFHRNCY
jgi:hypothetical protein